MLLFAWESPRINTQREKLASKDALTLPVNLSRCCPDHHSPVHIAIVSIVQIQHKPNGTLECPVEKLDDVFKKNDLSKKELQVLRKVLKPSENKDPCFRMIFKAILSCSQEQCHQWSQGR